MAKSVNDVVLDAALNYPKTNSTTLTVCSAQPTTYAEATSTYMLASISISSSDYTGPADGDVSGRKITVGAKSGTVTNSGTATHVALTTGSVLLYVDTCASQVLTATNPLTVNSWKIEIADPS